MKGKEVETLCTGNSSYQFCWKGKNEINKLVIWDQGREMYAF